MGQSSVISTIVNGNAMLQLNPQLQMQRHGYGTVIGRLLILVLYGVCFWMLLKVVYWGQIPNFLNYERGPIFIDIVDDISPYTVPPLAFKDQKKDLLERIEVNCEDLHSTDNKTLDKLRTWHYNYENVERDITESADKCAAIKSLFKFPTEPYSKEEAEYPLAYGILVYKEVAQVLFMLSSFYHPQNEYCIAVSKSAQDSFKKMMKHIGKCFPNIKVLERPKIFWGSYEIINSTYACMKTLAETKTPWKYFQYLSGVDIPLRTNLEMVKMLKAMNNTINAEVKSYQGYRAKKKNITDSPIPPYKSSLSATIPRPSVDFMLKSDKTQKLLDWLNGTSIPDEGFWGTVGGNPGVFPIPGGYNASAWLKYRTAYYQEHKEEVTAYKNKKVKMRYYLSRYQVWNVGCAGKMKAASCVFGIGDYSTVIKQPHLVAHKFYIDFEPAAFFCALKEIRNRTLKPVSFDVSKYREIPQVELNKGVPFEKLTHPNWLY